MTNLINNFLQNLKLRLKAKRVANSTVKELQDLTDRELNDIGIARCNIGFIAEKHYNDVINSNLKGWV